jgi:ArsR family transcriptional regulator
MNIIQCMLNYRLDQETRGTGLESDALIRMLKALGDPTRLRILDMLMEGVQCNCEISERLGLSLNLISHHLRVLREAGLIQSERAEEDARWIYYTVDQDALVELNEALGHLLDAARIQPRVPTCGPRSCKSCS